MCSGFPVCGTRLRTARRPQPSPPAIAICLMTCCVVGSNPSSMRVESLVVEKRPSRWWNTPEQERRCRQFLMSKSMCSGVMIRRLPKIPHCWCPKRSSSHLIDVMLATQLHPSSRDSPEIERQDWVFRRQSVWSMLLPAFSPLPWQVCQCCRSASATMFCLQKTVRLQQLPAIGLPTSNLERDATSSAGIRKHTLSRLVPTACRN